MAVKLELDVWVMSLPERQSVAPSRLAISLGASQKNLKNKFADMDTLCQQGWALHGEMMESIARLLESIHRVREAEIKGKSFLPDR